MLRFRLTSPFTPFAPVVSPSTWPHSKAQDASPPDGQLDTQHTGPSSLALDGSFGILRVDTFALASFHQSP